MHDSLADLTSSLSLSILERGWLSSNCFLFMRDQDSVLVDSGYHSHAKQTLAWVKRHLQGRPLSRLINTHLHSDHCGGNALLQAQFQSLKTTIPMGSFAAVSAWDACAFTFHATGQHCDPFQVDDAVDTALPMLIAGQPWVTLAAKGHDPDAIVLFHESSGTLISGDALWCNGFGVVFPELEGEAAFNEVSQTLDMIESLHPRWVLPGHGPAFNDVKQAISRARSRLDFFVQSPEKHRRYAQKVLVKFKLLEWQRVHEASLLEWCMKTPYLVQHMPREIGPAQGWLNELLMELQRSHALTRRGEWIENI